MAVRTPTDVKNLDGYGNEPLEWNRVERQLAGTAGPDVMYVLGTVRPDGRPHAASIGAVWHDGDFYLVSGPGTRKSRNLAQNPAFTLTVNLEGVTLVVEGTATRVTDRPTLEALVKVYNGHGWPAKVEGDAFTAEYSAPSAGPPPWYLYRLTYDTAFGVAGAEPYGATRWRFDG